VSRSTCPWIEIALATGSSQVPAKGVRGNSVVAQTSVINVTDLQSEIKSIKLMLILEGAANKGRSDVFFTKSLWRHFTPALHLRSITNILLQQLPGYRY
jgi:hypothetical protein